MSRKEDADGEMQKIFYVDERRRLEWSESTREEKKDSEEGLSRGPASKRNSVREVTIEEEMLTIVLMEPKRFFCLSEPWQRIRFLVSPILLNLFPRLYWILKSESRLLVVKDR